MDSRPLLHLPSLCWRPRRYRPGGVGNWSGHTPFACDLITSLSPSTLVELGVHYGESYFAFCQAISESHTACKAFGVDSWQGDQHTGQYGEEVFAEVEAHNREFYNAFSELVRRSFDEAANRFETESIDILHIDGAHTYECVRHDFETWFPKIRPGGVVLLHDTAGRSGGFEVWRLWEDIRHLYPSFEFTHSCGLGVLQKPGTTPQKGIAPILFDTRREIADEEIRHYYELCAERLEYKYRYEMATRRGSWELDTQVFWRAPDEDFVESRSARIYHTIGTTDSEIRIPIPPLTCRPRDVRLDFSDRPLVLSIKRISILNRQGQETCRVDLDLLPAQPHSAGTYYLENTSHEGIRIHVTDTDPFTLLPINDAALEQLTEGGFIEIVMCGLEADFCLVDLNAQLHDSRLQYRQRVAECEAEIGRLTSGLAEAQRIVVNRDAELHQYVDAFERAQRLALQRDDELHQYSKALEHAQEVVADRDTELRDLRATGADSQQTMVEAETRRVAHAKEVAEVKEALSQALNRLDAVSAELQRVQHELAEKECDFANQLARLAAIEHSLAWRIVRPLAGVGNKANSHTATKR